MSDISIVAKKTLLSTPYLDVVETTINKDGKEHVHTNVIQQDSVFVFPITVDKDIYLVSQYRYLLNRQMTEAVAGMVDKGEDPLLAAKRELQEETGLVAREWKKLATVERGASFVRGVYHLYLAQNLEQKEQHLDDFEDLSVKKMQLIEAITMAFSPDMNTSGTVIGLLLLDKMVREGNL